MLLFGDTLLEKEAKHKYKKKDLSSGALNRLNWGYQIVGMVQVVCAF